MTTTAFLTRPGNQHKSTAAGTVAIGTVAISPEGNFVVLLGLKSRTVGQEVTWDNGEVYSISKGAIAFSEGDPVYFDGTDIQKTGFVRVGRAAANALSGDSSVIVRLLKDCVLTRYVSTAAGSALTNSTTPTNLAVAPTIPANVLKAGDVIRIRALVKITAQTGTDSLTVKARLTPATSGSAVDLASTGAVDPGTDDIAIVEIDLIIRTIGVSGTMVGIGRVGIGASAALVPTVVDLPSATIDTTQGQIIGIQGTWGSASASDSCRCEILSAELIRN